MKWIVRVAIGLAAVVAIAVLLLLAMGHRAGAGTVHVSTDIHASPQQVWAWINDADKLKQWVTWLVEVRRSGSPNTCAGRTETWVLRDANNGGKFMEIEAACKDFVPPSRMEVAMSSKGSFDGDATYVLKDLGNGVTRLDYDGHFRYVEWFAALLEPVITPSAEKKMREDVGRLKSLVEHGV